MQRPIKRRKYRTKYNDIEVKKSLIKDFENGLTLKDLQWRYDLSPIGLKKVMLRYGIYKQKRENRIRFAGIKRFNALVDYFNGMPIQSIIEKYKINKRTLYYTYDSLVLQKYKFKERKLERRKGYGKNHKVSNYIYFSAPIIVERIENGERLRPIAEDYGVSYSVFKGMLYRYKIDVAKHRKIFTDKIVNELKNGARIDEMMEKYGMSRSGIWKLFKKECGTCVRKYKTVKVRKEMWNRMEKFDFKSQNDRFWRLVRAKKAAKKKVTLEDLDRKGSY